MTYLVYPGASHTRFEHSLGVMDLAGRVFDTITRPGKVHPNLTVELRDFLFHSELSAERNYWKNALRMAALCHDIGHPPFSHAAEKALYPADWGKHERMTSELVRSDHMEQLWAGGHNSAGEDIPYNPDHIVQLAIGPTKSKRSDDGDSLIVPERTGILAEIISGDAFGVDRADYLLRDSYHLGVAYGQFDLHRLIDTLVVLPAPGPLELEEGEEEPSIEPGVGIEEGGLQVAEALTVARYAMYSQVYYHPIRRIYDKHLTDYLRVSLEGGVLPIDATGHLGLTDAEILSAVRRAARDESHLGHDPAKRILHRGHYRVLWNNNEIDKLENPAAVKVIAQELVKEFGENSVKIDEESVEMRVSFRVLQSDGNVVPATTISSLINRVPDVIVQRVYVAPERFSEAQEWWKEHRVRVLQESPETFADEIVEEEFNEPVQDASNPD